MVMSWPSIKLSCLKPDTAADSHRFSHVLFVFVFLVAFCVIALYKTVLVDKDLVMVATVSDDPNDDTLRDMPEPESFLDSKKKRWKMQQVLCMFIQLGTFALLGSRTFASCLYCLNAVTLS
jgi:hypothetical protein